MGSLGKGSLPAMWGERLHPEEKAWNGKIDFQGERKTIEPVETERSEIKNFEGKKGKFYRTYSVGKARNLEKVNLLPCSGGGQWTS